ncbi:DNA polymerase IV [Bifidobacterium goeldii]|nr:DNA polymerase IV [Bifidobacterium goeldii]
MSTAPRLAAAKRDWGHDETGCTVLHIDMDAFYASLEVARHPELKGKPVIIGTGPRSVVSAASYEARRYGINSAMPSARAHQLCPNGVFLPVDMTYYRMMSQRIFREVFSQITNRIEKVSVDECYMDVSGALLHWDRPSAIGAWIRAEVASRYHVTCSVGIAANKLVAKMASTNAKPDGMLLIPLDRHAEFVQMMPLRGIPGIGPALEKRLLAWGANSVADLAAMDEASLTRACGSATLAHGLYLASRGQDTRAVTPYTPEKSIGAERTFSQDTRDMRRVCGLLRWACDDVASSLRRRGLLARTVTVKLRFADLTYMTKAHTMERPVDTASALYPQCVTLLRAMLGVAPSASEDSALPREIRLAGMSASGLVEAAGAVIQPTLDDLLEETGASSGTQASTPAGTHAGTQAGAAAAPAPATKATRLREAEQALDAVRRKYGHKAASLGL